jgi:putative endonuclease
MGLLRSSKAPRNDIMRYWASSSTVEQSRLSRDWFVVNLIMYLYILKNTRGIFYIGISKNIDNRLIDHNLPNSHFTGRLKGPWQLIFVRNFETVHEARKEEIRLKRAKNKRYLDWYIKNNNQTGR